MSQSLEAEVLALRSQLDSIMSRLKEDALRTSQFKAFSLVLVLENKPRTLSDVLVAPVEISNLLDGALAADVETVEHAGKDFYGESYTVKVQARQGIRCKWLQLGSNRATAPDVRRGERVMIYRFADTDEYYWKEMGLDDHLRRLETVAWLFSADPDGVSNEPKSAANSYTFEVSTHDKLITLQTTALNAEPYTYTFQFNTGDGLVTLADNDGNYVELNSKETSITLQNREETRVVLTGKNIEVFAPNNIDVEAIENIAIRCKNLSVTVGENATVDVGKAYSTTVGEAVTIKSASYSLESGPVNVKADEVVIDSPTSSFTGVVSAGAISIASGAAGGDGGLSIAGNAAVEGALNVTGAMQVTGAITCQKLTSIEPISAPNV